MPRFTSIIIPECTCMDMDVMMSSGLQVRICNLIYGCDVEYQFVVSLSCMCQKDMDAILSPSLQVRIHKHRHTYIFMRIHDRCKLRSFESNTKMRTRMGGGNATICTNQCWAIFRAEQKQTPVGVLRALSVSLQERQHPGFKTRMLRRSQWSGEYML